MKEGGEYHDFLLNNVGNTKPSWDHRRINILTTVKILLPQIQFHGTSSGKPTLILPGRTPIPKITEIFYIFYMTDNL